ncbi:hypothetical protein F383_35534 [Gossypium arboreum]|uniref:Uncharacterized protein n=1 Tax=Gossypium arboreum TaxID=29729 RepID=A0A0B0PRE4_GOSAR|nr:hypothetical protein F383_35534 [Gossypium arboreum]
MCCGKGFTPNEQSVDFKCRKDLARMGVP